MGGTPGENMNAQTIRQAASFVLAIQVSNILSVHVPENTFHVPKNTLCINVRATNMRV
jgi:hypothetical protein